MMRQAPDLSIVVPAFNEEENVAPLVAHIREALDTSSLSWEVIFVDDGSTDDTRGTAEHIAQNEHRMRVISLPHRGKAWALRIGFARAQGSVIATLDADLQDDPRELPAMYALIIEGQDLVCGWKQNRRDPYIRKVVPSKFFNWVVSTTSGVSLHDHNCGLKVYRASLAKSLPLEGQLHRFIPMLANALDYTAIVEVPVLHSKRLHGTSKYGPSRFLYGLTGLVQARSIARSLRHSHTAAVPAAQI